MPDPVLDAARRAVGQGFDTLRLAVQDLPADALNWRPASPEETNPIAVLVSHAAHSTRMLLRMAAGLPLPSRDRPAEFAAVAEGPAPLLALIDGLHVECEAILGSMEGVDWGARRQRRRDDGSISEMTAAEALLHAATHLRGHADEAALTRHLWQARG